ncbi:MAG: hypothetical protein JOS17DRAFT_773336 [Linnemannia elongata]|nr:MAG: hypothetical protein JOS17DRAFT_773336 [Linnemannia elongata]
MARAEAVVGVSVAAVAVVAADTAAASTLVVAAVPIAAQSDVEAAFALGFVPSQDETPVQSKADADHRRSSRRLPRLPPLPTDYHRRCRSRPSHFFLHCRLRSHSRYRRRHHHRRYGLVRSGLQRLDVDRHAFVVCDLLCLFLAGDGVLAVLTAVLRVLSPGSVSSQRPGQATSLLVPSFN